MKTSKMLNVYRNSTGKNDEELASLGKATSQYTLDLIGIKVN